MFLKFVVPSVAVFAVSAFAQTPILTVEEIAAKVNGDIITRGQLEEKHKELEMQAKQEGLTGPKLQEVLKSADGDVLRNEIDTLLLVQKAKDLPGLNVEAEVTKFFQNWQTSVKISDQDKFHEY